MDLTSIYNLIQVGGVVAVLLIVLCGFVKKWWVMGWQYKAIEESNARWMELALRSANLSQSIAEMKQERPIIDSRG